MKQSWVVMVACILGASGLAMGAIGSHAVSEQVAKDWIRLGSNYQLIHSLAILASVAILRRFHFSQLLFVFGILLFSGGLYGLAFTGHEIFRSLTPYGGMSLIFAWFWSGFVLKSKNMGGLD